MAASVTEIVQQARSFAIAEVHIAAGSVLRFSNQDEFDHQVFVEAPGMHVDTEESEPGQKLDVAFPLHGTFEVRCHIHPRMHLTVVVE